MLNMEPGAHQPNDMGDASSGTIHTLYVKLECQYNGTIPSDSAVLEENGGPVCMFYSVFSICKCFWLTVGTVGIRKASV